MNKFWAVKQKKIFFQMVSQKKSKFPKKKSKFFWPPNNTKKHILRLFCTVHFFYLDLYFQNISIFWLKKPIFQRWELKLKKFQLPEPYNFILHYLVCLSIFFLQFELLDFDPCLINHILTFFWNTLQVQIILNLHCYYKIWIVPKSGTPQINIEGSRIQKPRDVGLRS